MNLLQLLPIGNLDDGLLKTLRPALEETFHVPCEVLPGRLDPEFAFHGERQQYHSSEMLQRRQSFLRVVGRAFPGNLISEVAGTAGGGCTTSA